MNKAPAKNALSNEAIPKSAARVLNAARVQEEFRKKRKLDGEGGADEGKKQAKKRKVNGNERKEKGNGAVQMKIMPGESLAHFNRCATFRNSHSVLAEVDSTDEWRSR